MKNKLKQFLDDWIAPSIFIGVIVWIILQITGVIKP